MISCLFIAALWSPAGKGLSSWLLFVMFNCVFVTFPCGILCQVWYLIVPIPDLCCLSYFVTMNINHWISTTYVTYLSEYKIPSYCQCISYLSQTDKQSFLSSSCHAESVNEISILWFYDRAQTLMTCRLMWHFIWVFSVCQSTSV